MTDPLTPNLPDYDLPGLRALLDGATAQRARITQQLTKIRAEIKRREKK